MRTREEQIANFWSNVCVKGVTQCWLYRGSPNSSTVWFCGVNTGAHRLAFFLSFAILPEEQEGKDVRHTCNCRGCCNPRHLILSFRSRIGKLNGTVKDLIKDRENGFSYGELSRK